MFVQKDIEMGQFDVSVQIDMNQNFQLVPENPETFNVNMPFLLFRTPNRPNIQVDNPQQNILYRVENNNGNLVVEEYPIENN